MSEVNGDLRNGGCNGIRTRGLAVVDRRAAANHHSARVVPAPLSAANLVARARVVLTISCGVTLLCRRLGSFPRRPTVRPQFRGLLLRQWPEDFGRALAGRERDPARQVQRRIFVKRVRGGLQPFRFARKPSRQCPPSRANPCTSGGARQRSRAPGAGARASWPPGRRSAARHARRGNARSCPGVTIDSMAVTQYDGAGASAPKRAACEIGAGAQLTGGSRQALK